MKTDLLRNNLIVFLLLLAVGITVYANAFQNEFVYDDRSTVVENVFIRDLANLPKVFVTDFHYFSPEKSNFYRPVATLSLMLDYQLFGRSPVGYHVVNTLLHVLAAFFVFLFTEKLASRGIALAVSLIFLVHPIQTESVTYISGRADILPMLFFSAAFYFYVRFRESNARRNFAVSLGAFALALLSKEIAVMLPFVLVLYELTYRIWDRRIPAGREFSDAPGLKEKTAVLFRRLRPTYAFFAAGAVYVFLRFTLLNFSGRLVHPTGAPVFLRILTFFRVFWFYLRLLAVPVGQNFEHAFSYVRNAVDPLAYVSLAGIILLAIFVWSKRRANKPLFFGAAWYFANLLLVSNILPLNAILFEHWLYLPSAGFFLFAVSAAAGLKGPLSQKFAAEDIKRIAAIVTVIILTALSLLTMRRNLDWRDEITFYKSILRTNPTNARVLNNLASLYNEAGMLGQAMQVYRRALEINPNDWKTISNMGVLYEKAGDLDAAMRHYLLAVKINPGAGEIWHNIAHLKEREGKVDEAVVLYRRALKVNPLLEKTRQSLAEIYARTGRADLTIAELEEKVKLDPRNYRDKVSLATAYVRAGNYDSAEKLLLRVVEAVPADISARNLLGLVYGRKGDFEAAEEQFLTAIDLAPTTAVLRYNLANLYRRTDRPELAREQYAEAIRLKPNLAEKIPEEFR